LPLEEPGPVTSQEESFVLGDEDVIEEAAEIDSPPTPVPASEMLLAEMEAEDAMPVAEEPSSAVLEAGEMVEEAEAIAEEAEPVAEEAEAIEEEAEAFAEEAEEIAEEAEPVVEEAEAFEEAAADEIEAAAPAPKGSTWPPMFKDEDAETASVEDDIVAADEAPVAAPRSDLFAAEEPIFPGAEPTPNPDSLVGMEPVYPGMEPTPDPDVFAADEPIADADEFKQPSSVVEAAEVAEEMPASDVLAAEMAAEEEIEPASAVMPASDVLAAEMAAEEVVEAASAVEAEEVVEADSAVEAEEVFGEDVTEALVPSEIQSGVMAEEVAEADEVSSATRKAEDVLDDEVMEAVEASAVSDDAMPVQADSGVVFDDLPAGSSAKKRRGAGKTVEYDKTIAFDGAPSDYAKKADDDALVTEEEVEGADEASAVNLGDMPKKGSSVTGIDKVAEALESGTDLAGDDAGKAAPSVEFDELLDDLGESDEGEIAEAVGEGSSTEMDAAVIDEDFDTVKAPTGKKKGAKEKKKGKAAAKATGDDIDLADMYGDEPAEAADAEAAEAADADGAEIFDHDEEGEPAKSEEAAEAAEAIDEDSEFATAAAAVDDDETEAKGKKGKKAHKKDEEDEDEDEDSDKKKKKAKKEKTRAADTQAQPSMALRWLGGMFIATFLVVGGLGAAMFFAPDIVRDTVDSVAGPKTTGIPQPPIVNKGGGEKTRLAKAHEAIGKRNYQEAVDELKDASGEAELGARGEAKWFVYAKAQADKKLPLNKDDAAVKEALKDLADANSKLMIDQINAALKEKELGDQLTNATNEKDNADKQLKVALAAKTSADKLFDSIADALVKSNIIKDKTELDAKNLNVSLKKLNDDQATLTSINKLLDQDLKGTTEEKLKQVLELKKNAETNVAAVNKVLETANIKDNGAKGVQGLVATRDNLQTEVKGLDAVITQAMKEFTAGNVLPANADPRKQLVEGAKLARLKSESPLSIPLAQLGMSLGGVGSGTSKLVEATFDLAKATTELGWYRTREKFIQSPQDKMNTHVAVLQDRGYNNAAELKAIGLEADWVLDPASKSDTDARAKAQYVKGLALRNQEKFAEARTSLEQAVKSAQGLTGTAWKDQLDRSHKELTDPNAYYLPRVDRLVADGNVGAALVEVNAAIRAMPNEAQLLARRGLVRFEFVRGQGAKMTDENAKNIRADADAAAKDEKVAAEAEYIHGLVDEALGKLDAAQQHYRTALKLHADGKGADDEAGKYRLALGRLLLRDRTEVAPVAPPPVEEKKKADDKTSRVNPSNAPTNDTTIIVHPLSLLLASAVISQPAGDDVEDKETLARLKEVMDEAEKLKASKNAKLQGQGHCLMGSALSKLGKRTEGLKEYAKGLQLLYPGIESAEINELIASHPAFQQPDSSGVPNPIMAERHFGEGVHLYWKGASNPKSATAAQDFKDAEGQFFQAIKYYDKDARYQYFLGMAQIQQKTKAKRDAAIFAFEQGARIEARTVQSNPFATREINQSLERVQGEMRQLINLYRYRPSTEPETTKKDVE